MLVHHGRDERAASPRNSPARPRADDQGLCANALVRVRRQKFGVSPTTRMILVGSPAFVAAYGQPQALADVARMPTLSTGPLGRELTWHFVDPESRPVELVHNPRLSADDFYTVRRAALRGLGVARLPALLARDDLSSGALVRLLPSLSAQSGVVHAVFPSSRGMVPAVRLLLDALSEGFAANPWFAGDGSSDRA